MKGRDEDENNDERQRESFRCKVCAAQRTPSKPFRVIGLIAGIYPDLCSWLQSL